MALPGSALATLSNTLGVGNGIGGPASAPPASAYSQVAKPGGYNYFVNGQPITVQQYNQGTGQNISPTAVPPATGAVLGASTGPATGAGGGAAYGFNAPGYIAGINQEYGSSIAGARQLEQANQSNLPIQQALIGQQAQANANEINAQASGSLNTLETQRSGVQSQQGLSLAELADQIRGQNQALLNNLGAVGAGSSSAVGAGQNALARVQNEGRADINNQATTNINTIGSEEQAVKDQQTTQLQALDAWKQSQIQSILQNYIQIQTQLQQQVGTAQGEEKARLAEFGQNVANAAGQALTQLDSMVKNQVNNLMSAQTSAAPTIQAAPTYQAPSALTVPTVSPFQASSPAAGNTTAAPTGGSLAALTGKLQQ